MRIVRIDESSAAEIAPLAAEFRVTLDSFRGVVREPDVASAKEEILEYLKIGYPVFAAAEGDDYLGYIVCRIDEPCLWVEHIFVRKEHRRKGAATLLFEKAEELARGMGEDTVFNYVHPNNDGMIGFLRSKGYTVLNLIEIRKPYAGEKLSTKISVADNVFDY